MFHDFPEIGRVYLCVAMNIGALRLKISILYPSIAVFPILAQKSQARKRLNCGAHRYARPA
ncbi:MAG: hypothetical protein KGM99_18125, partial [Burkholderiales bacterium]|nr:hypothetical protein [Burkholderiales bacterium]